MKNNTLAVLVILLGWANTTPSFSDPSPVSQPAVGTFSVLGITTGVGYKSLWWDATGKPLSRIPSAYDPDGMGSVQGTGETCKGVIVAHGFPAGTLYTVAVIGTNDTITSQSSNETPGDETIQFKAALPAGATDFHVVIGTALPVWKLVTSFEAIGLYGTSGRADDIGMYSLLVSPLCTIDGSPAVTYTTTAITKAATDMIAIDKAGNLFVGASSGSVSSGDMTETVTGFPNANLQDIKSLAFRESPYQFTDLDLPASSKQ